MQEIKLEQPDYQKARSPTLLRSGGLGPCVALGAICGQYGSMIHVIDPRANSEFSEILRDLSRKDISRLQIYVAGACADFDNYKPEHIRLRRKEAEETRRYVLHSLDEHNLTPALREVRWGNHDEVLELLLFLDEQRGEIQSFPLDP